MNDLRSEFNEEPQYDYAYSNEELFTPEERRQGFIKGIKGLVSHIAHKFTDVAKDIGADTKPSPFNDTLSVPNGFNARNPLAIPNIRVSSRSSVRPRRRFIRNMRSTKVYRN
jgi:hypothetical protein